MTGFNSPNWTAVPNDFFEMMCEMSRAEYLVTMVAFRQILGFHKQAPEPISISQFVAKTRMNRTSVVKGIKEAVKRGTLKKHDGNHMETARYEIVFLDEPSTENVPAPSAEIALPPSTEIVPTKEKVVKEKETTSTPDGVQTTAETAEKKKEPVKQPITDVVKELETQFGIVSTGWQIAHIIQGSYKATKRKTSQTTVWVELTTRFAEEPATPEMVVSFAKWYKQKTNGLSLKNTDTFLNHYAEWFKDYRQTVQKRNPVTPVGKMQPAAPIETVTVDVEDMQAFEKMLEEQRKKIKGEAA